MIQKFDTNAVDDLIRESLGSDENLEIYLNDIPEDEATIAQLMKEVFWKNLIKQSTLGRFTLVWPKKPTTYCATIPTSIITLL